MALLKMNLKLLTIKLLNTQITYFSLAEKSFTILFTSSSFLIMIFFLLGLASGESLNILLAILVNNGPVAPYWISISSCDPLNGSQALDVPLPTLGKILLVSYHFFTVVIECYGYYHKGLVLGYANGLLLHSNKTKLTNQPNLPASSEPEVKKKQEEPFDLTSLSYNTMFLLLLTLIIFSLLRSISLNYTWAAISSFFTIIAFEFLGLLVTALLYCAFIISIIYSCYRWGYYIGQLNHDYDCKKEEVKNRFLKNNQKEQNVFSLIWVLVRMLLWVLGGVVAVVFSTTPHYLQTKKNGRFLLVKHSGFDVLSNNILKLLGGGASLAVIWEFFKPKTSEISLPPLPPTIHYVTHITEVVKNPGLNTSTVVIGAVALVGVTSLVSYYFHRSHQLKNLEENIGLLQEKIKFFEEQPHLTFKQQWQLIEAKKKLSHLLPDNNNEAAVVNRQQVVDHPQPVVVNFEFDPNLANYSPLAAKLGLKPNPSAGDYFLPAKPAAVPSFHHGPGPRVRDNADLLSSPYEHADLLPIIPPGALSVLLMVFQLGLLWVNHPYLFWLTYDSSKRKFDYLKSYGLISLGLSGLLVLLGGICLY